MSRPNRESRGALGLPLRQLGAAVFVIALAVALIFSGGRRSAWPFAHWWLYHAGTPQPRDAVELHQVRVLDGSGRWQRFWPRELFTLDDDSSSQDIGHHVVTRAVDPTNPRQRKYQQALIRRVSRLIDSEPVRVEVWNLTWRVNYAEYPPLKIDQVVGQRLVLALPGSQYP